jgi:hypothetical protein
MTRELPKTGEIWRHYKGEECRILGVLRNGNKGENEQLIVAYELVERQVNSPRYWRWADDFMSEASKDGKRVPRFDRQDDDLWMGFAQLLDEVV